MAESFLNPNTSTGVAQLSLPDNVLTPDEYRQQYVDYYSQTLGTGISADVIDTGEEKEKEETPVSPTVALSPVQAGQDGPTLSTTNVIGKGTIPKFDVKSYTTKDINITNYAKSINPDLTENFISKNLGLTGVGFKTPSKSEIAVGSGLTAATGQAMFGVVGTALMGEGVQKVFGSGVTYRPGGFTGAVFDLAQSFHANNASKISSLGGGAMMEINGMQISRAPGSFAYTGNLSGLSQKEVMSLEAFSKGYIPGTLRDVYNEDYGTYDTYGESIDRSGGVVADKSGFYQADGSWMSATGQGSLFGSMTNAKNTAKNIADKYGVDYSVDDFLSDLSVTRSGKGNLNDIISSTVEGKKSTTDASEGAGTGEPTSQPSTSTVSSDYSARPDRQGPGGGRDVSGAAGGATGGVGRQGEGSGWGGMAQGGRVGLQAGGMPGQMTGQSGFVDQPPSQVPEGETVADNVETQLPEGAFVINAAAVEFAGEQDIKKMLLDAHGEAVRRGLAVDKQGNGANMIDVAISRGEVVVAPHLAKIIGLDRLQKINNRGKRETQQRIEENGQQPVAPATAALGGGFFDWLFGIDRDVDVTNPRSNVPATSFDQETEQGFVEKPQEPSAPLPSLTEQEEAYRSVLTVAEGNKNEGYVPSKNSGVTIGLGFDIGQHSVSDLERMGFSSSIISKFTPYVNKKGNKAENALEKDPIELSDSELEEVNTLAIRKKNEEFEKKYPQYTDLRSVDDKAVMFSVYWLGAMPRYKAFRKSFEDSRSPVVALQDGVIEKINNPKDPEYNRAENVLEWYRERNPVPVPPARPAN
jgi:hypothetical protein